MKFCSKCGAELHDEAVICPKCGCTVAVVKTENPPKKANVFDVFGVIALVFGILGIVDSIPGFIPIIGLPFNIINTFLALFAIIFGAIGIAKASSNGKCKGALTTGIIAMALNIVGCIIVIVAGAVASTVTGSGFSF